MQGAQEISREAAHNWDVALTIGMFVIGGLVSIIGIFFKKKMDAYDKHLDECHVKDIAHGITAERVSALDKQMGSVRSDLHWLGDCMVTMGAKLEVNLPDRPPR